MAIQAATVTFDSIQVGDELPSIQKTETQETINAYAQMQQRQVPPPAREHANLHIDEEFADAGIFVGTVNTGVVTCAYVTELLQLAFPTKSILNGTFSMRALEPFRPGDTATFTGKVVGKREEGGKRLVDVELTGNNQLGQAIASGKATVPL